MGLLFTKYCSSSYSSITKVQKVSLHLHYIKKGTIIDFDQRLI